MFSDHAPSMPSVLDVFACLPADIRDAALSISAGNAEADPSMIRTHLLSVLSSAIAPFYRLHLPGWTPIPISVNTLCVVGVGGSKSPVHKALIEPLEHYRQFSHRQHADDCSAYEARVSHHRVKLEIAKTEAKRARRSGLSFDEAMADLSTLTGAVIAAPKFRPRRADHLDLESLLVQLNGEGESVDFITDEGEKFLSSSLMRHVPHLCDLIDGESLEYRRERKRPLFAESPCATFGLMAQPSAIMPFRPRQTRKEYVEHKAVTMGFFARLLVCVASANDQPLPSTVSVSEASLEALKFKLRDLYDRQNQRLRNCDFSRIDVHLAPNAESYWKELVRLTSEMKRGSWRHVSDFVSKMLSHVGRVAAVLHLWCSDTNFISLEALRRAWEIVYWHLHQYESVFVPQPLAPQSEADVAAIVSLVREQYWGVKAEQVSTEEIGLLLALPNNRLRAALLRLSQRGLTKPCLSSPGSINCVPIFSQSRQITLR